MNQLVETIAVTVVPSPFEEPKPCRLVAGMRLPSMLDQLVRMGEIDAVCAPHVVAYVNGDEVTREWWPLVTVKRNRATVVCFSVEPKGDSAVTALNVASLGVGLLVNPLAGALIGIGGSLILSAFQKKPKAPGIAGPQSVAETNQAGTSKNVLPANEQIPAVAGRRRVPLPLIAPSYVELVGTDLFLVMLMGLQGQTRIDEELLNINGVALGEFSDSAEVDIRQGAASDAPLTLYDRQVIQEPRNEEMSEFDIDPNGPLPFRSLVDDGARTEETTSRPHWHYATTGASPDEFRLSFIFPQGVKPLDASASIGVPILVEARLKGETDFRSFPYYYISVAGRSEALRFDLRFLWGEDPTINAYNAEPWLELTMNATQTSAAEKAFDAGNFDWAADSYFGVTSSAVEADHLARFRDRIETYLDPADWPKGEYEFRFRKWPGAAPIPTTHQTSLQLYVWHDFTVGKKLAQSLSWSTAYDKQQSRMTLEYVTSIWNEAPVTAPDMAKVALRIRNTQVNEVTAMASGITATYNDTDWGAEVESDRPADWYRRAMTDKYLAQPLPAALVDDAELAIWSLDNAAQGQRFNALLQGGTTVEDVLGMTTLAGKARKARGSKWSVWRDRDRSADQPVQILTPMNSRGFEIEKDFEEIPDALRISFDDEDNEYRPREVLINANGDVVTETIISESVPLTGKTSLGEAREWGRYLLQLRIQRDALYGTTVGLRSLHAQAGKLIGVTHNVLSTKFGYAVATKLLPEGVLVGGTVVGLELNNHLPFDGGEAVDNIFAPANIFALQNIFKKAIDYGIVIELSDGTTAVHQVNERTPADVVTFTTPFVRPSALKAGAIVGSGVLGTETERFLISGIRPAADDTARLVLVDEAPSIHVS